MSCGSLPGSAHLARRLPGAGGCRSRRPAGLRRTAGSPARCCERRRRTGTGHCSPARAGRHCRRCYGEILADDYGADQRQTGDTGQRHGTTAPGQTRRIERPAHRALQDQVDQQGQHGDQAQQEVDWVGLHDVVQHLVGVDQVIHRDKVEAHPELIPEQPFGQRREKHEVKAQPHQQVQAEAMEALAPQAARAEQYVEGQRDGGECEEGQVVHCAFEIDPEQLRGRRSLPANVRPAAPSGSTGIPEPETQEQDEIAKLSMTEKRHRMIHG